MNRNCDMCGKPAMVDTKTIYGYWAFLCEECNERYGLKHWNTLLANVSEGGTPVSTTDKKEYEWIEGRLFYSQAIYKDTVKAIASNTIEITMRSGKTKLVTEGNIALLRCIMNIAMTDQDYPVRWKVV